MAAIVCVDLVSDHKVMPVIVVVLRILQLMPQKLYCESECFWICMHNTCILYENENTTAFSIGLDRVVHS